MIKAIFIKIFIEHDKRKEIFNMYITSQCNSGKNTLWKNDAKTSLFIKR